MRTSERLTALLHEGEILDSTPEHSLEWPGKGSRLASIKYTDGTTEQSVLLDMDKGGYVSPVHDLQEGVTFTVRSVAGRGTAFVQRAGSLGIRRVRLRGDRQYVVTQGDVVGYVAGTLGEPGSWTVRDDCNIPYDPSFEGRPDESTPLHEGGLVVAAVMRARQIRADEHLYYPKSKD